jgi:hypothetical protein
VQVNRITMLSAGRRLNPSMIIGLHRPVNPRKP